MRFPAAHRFSDWFQRLSVQRKLLLLGLIVLFLLLSPGLYQRAAWLYGRTTCSLSGGTWTRGGIAGTLFCVHTYPDAGKPCQSSDECMGGCVLYEVIWGQPPPGEGVCKTNNDPFECFAPIEYPEFYGCAD
jgi:hypothetical protein